MEVDLHQLELRFEALRSKSASKGRRVWVECLSEEMLLLWAERDRDPIFDRFRDFH